MHSDLSCSELVELVTGYLDGALPAADRARFERHLAECPGCAAYLDQMRAVIRAAGSLRESDLSPAARDALLSAFRDWRG